LTKFALYIGVDQHIGPKVIQVREHITGGTPSDSFCRQETAKMSQIQFLALCLLPVWVAAQSPSLASSKTVTAPSPATKDSLPTITPFVIPPGVLSGLGIPLVIPAAEPNVANDGRPRPGAMGARGGKGGFGGMAAAPRAQPAGKMGRRPPQEEIGPFGMQGGLPYELCG
jgi:hypothetical protein